MKSALQKEAERQALAMQIELSQYRQSGPFDFAKACQTLNQSSKWHISHETLNGDFALDEVLAQTVASRVVSKNPEASWLHDYLNWEPGSFGESVLEATVGKTNVPGNLNAARQAAEAAIAQRKISGATARILAKSAQSVRINSNMILYNANKNPKGMPRLRVKVTGQPVKVISSTLSKDAAIPRPVRGGFSARARDVERMVELESMASKARFFNGKLGGGILTFAPTMAFDLYDSVNRDANGNLNWNRRQFINSELKNQPGNAVGWGIGAGVGIIAGVALGITGAPLIVVVLIAGIAAQAIWNWSGAPDQMPQIRSEGGY